MTPLSQACAAARTQIPVAPLPAADHGPHLAGGPSRFLCLSFFAAAKKVSAAPHRGNANKPKPQLVGKESKYPPRTGATPIDHNRIKRSEKSKMPPPAEQKKLTPYR